MTKPQHHGFKLFLLIVSITLCLGSDAPPQNATATPNLTVLNCTYQYMSKLSPEMQCIIARDPCSENADLVNLYAIYFCHMNGYKFCALVIIFTLMLIAFRAISYTCENYVVPSITYFCNFFRISQDISAVTLLALASGSGDMITSFVATHKVEAISYGIGIMFGAGLFASSVVFPLLILGTPTQRVKIDRQIVWREVIFYIISLLITIGYLYTNLISLDCIFSYFMLYIVYLIVVIFYDLKKNNPIRIELLSDNRMSKSLQFGNDAGVKSYKQILSLTSSKQSFLQSHNNTQNRIKAIELGDQDHEIQLSLNEEEEGDLLKYQHLKQDINSVANNNPINDRQLTNPQEFNYQLSNNLNKKRSFVETLGFIFDKTLCVLDMPFFVAVNITAPPVEEEHFNKFKLFSFCLLGPLFLFSTLFENYFNPYYYYVGIPWSVTLLIYYVSQLWGKPFKQYPHGKLQQFFLNLHGCFFGFCWCYIISEQLVDLVEFLSVLTGIGTTFNGIVLLAIGNSLQDAFIVINVAKNGLVDMAIIGNYAAQMVGIMIGFNLTLLKLLLKQDILQPSFFAAGHLTDQLVIIITLLVLVITFFYGLKNQYTFDKKIAYILISIYSIFVLGCTIQEAVRISSLN